MAELTGRTLVEGEASGEVLALSVPLSFWGGLDAATGRVIDRSHPALGRCVAGRILAMPGGRGSSSSSAVLAEAIRRGTGPAAIVLSEPDPIIAVGAIVALRLYGRACPVVVCDAATLRRIAACAVLSVFAQAGGRARLGFEDAASAHLT